MAQTWYSSVPRSLTELVDSLADQSGISELVLTRVTDVLAGQHLGCELDASACLITDHINIPPANNNATLLLPNPE